MFIVSFQINTVDWPLRMKNNYITVLGQDETYLKKDKPALNQSREKTVREIFLKILEQD